RTLSIGPLSLIGWLAVVTAIVVLVMTGVVYLAGISFADNPPDQIWAYLMVALDTDTLLSDPWALRLSTTVVVFLSMFVTSALIGLISAGIDSRLEQLRKGRSRVVESGHTVILGWSAKIMPIISELVVANANQPRATIAILALKDKVEMEDTIRARIGDTGHTRIVCRTGSSMDMPSLDLMSLDTAKSIIVLSPDRSDPDSAVIKTLLAITNNPSRSPEPYRIVAAIRNPANMEVARLAAGEEAELVLIGDVIARIAAQTCRQSGLPVVYTELLNFAGDEIYFKLEPRLAGKSFSEALLAYESSTVMGICPEGGPPAINPPMDTVFQDGAEVIAVSEDDNTVILSGLTDLGINEHAIVRPQPVEAAPEHVVILGWNWRAPYVIAQLDEYVASGSRVTVMADMGEPEADLANHRGRIEHLAVSLSPGETTSRPVLDGLPFDDVDHVILLAYSDVVNADDADARTLITLLHLRDIADRTACSFSIVSELMDSRNTDLAQAARADDFIVSDRVVSLILAHVAEDTSLRAVLASLFDPMGSEIYLRASDQYVALNEPLNFYTVVESARRQGEVALGYRVHEHAGDPKRRYGVVLNPDKSAPITFREGDRVIVLAEK
ncbi:MAG: potassium transporter TrkA, partial [Anaerolineae bacterium]